MLSSWNMNLTCGKKNLRYGYDTITIHHIHHDHIRWYTWFHQCSNTKQILSSSPSSSSIPIPIIRFLASHNPIKNWINKLDQSFKNSAIATDDKEEEIFASNQTINNQWSRHRSKWTTRVCDEIHESNNDLKTTLVYCAKQYTSKFASQRTTVSILK